ncbi:sialidase family protein [Brachyspira pilosicoli]|uniref:sialidase family protein n=1 Tax=Brachyspira pilosicoli TaxID=52584 RepID=UPI002666AFAA|nr:sialidase family protein [Brachyspira pilosicoli]
MSKLKLFLILASALLISCANPNDPDNGNDTGTGGGGTGGGGTGNPSWFLTAEKQKTPWSIDKTLAITVSGKAHYRITGILATKHAKNNNKIIAIYDNRKTSNADIGFTAAANLEPLIKISEDGGNTWGAEITVGPVATSKDTSHGDPVIFEANNGDIVVLAAAGGAWATAPSNPSRISVIKSTDGGKNWGQAVKIPPIAQKKEDSHGDPLIFSCKDGTLVVLCAAGNAWAQQYGTQNDSKIKMSKSTDDGQSWSQWTEIQKVIYDNTTV